MRRQLSRRQLRQMILSEIRLLVERQGDLPDAIEVIEELITQRSEELNELPKQIRDALEDIALHTEDGEGKKPDNSTMNKWKNAINKLEDLPDLKEFIPSFQYYLDSLD